MRSVAAAAGALGLALAPGCGEPPEETGGEEAEAAAPTRVPPSPAPSDAMRSPSVVTSDRLPANFPEDVPQHPDARVLESKATRDLGLAVTMIVEDDPEAVASFYADSLAAAGWTTDIHKMPDGTSVFADKGDRSAGVLVIETGRGAEVQLILSHH